MELDVPMSTIVTDDLYFDINMVDENGNYENMLCLDYIYTVQLVGDLEEGVDCGTDKTYQYNGDPLAVGDIMDGSFINIAVDRPSEFELSCIYLVFEFTYTDINGNTCSYFGDITLIFFPLSEANYTCGPIDNAGSEDCDFPSTLGWDNEEEYELFENFANNFQITTTSMCGYEIEMNPLDIFFLGDELCLPVPPGGCAEVELTDCLGNLDNCVSAIDLVELRKLLLGWTLETPSPYGAFLADINQSGTVSTLDLVQIQKDILETGLGNDYDAGDCVIFDPTDAGLDGEDLDGYGDWSAYDSYYTVEVCDGGDFELVMGVLGDVNGDCGCATLHGLYGDDDEDVVLFDWDEKDSEISGPDIYFYDLALDLTGNISAIDVLYGIDESVAVGIYQRDEGYAITINSMNSTPLSLIEYMSYLSIEGNGEISTTDKSFIIDVNTKLHGVSLINEEALGRSTDSSFVDDALFSLEVRGNTVQVYRKEDLDENTNLYLYTPDGRLISYKDLSGQNNTVDFSDDLSLYNQGSIFFVVGEWNGMRKVEKLVFIN